MSIALVTEGSFTYTSDTGRALLYPGALLLCNHGSCFQCGHDHSFGDRCVSAHLGAEAFAEIASTAAGSSRFRFPVGMLPATRDLLPHAAVLGALENRRDPLEMEEALTRFMAAAIRLLSGARPAALRISALDVRRVARALRHMEANAHDTLDLDQIASVAAMSKFHFLRAFRRTAGVTPHQYLLNLRLRHAAQHLLTTNDPVSKIAFDVGLATCPLSILRSAQDLAGARCCFAVIAERASDAGPMTRFSLFPTPLGACGIAWCADTVVATHLPERSDSATAARLARISGAVPGDPPPAIQRAIASIAALLGGEKADLGFIACDFNKINSFSRRVYAATRAIPHGQTLTYGDIAAQLGDKLLAQQVGQALGRNPFPIIIPCHRVMGANGRLTGFSANGGVETKLKLLAIEGAQIGEASGLFGQLPLSVKPQR